MTRKHFKVLSPDSKPAWSFMAVLTISDYQEKLHFGPFNTYKQAAAFAEEKISEYSEPRRFYVDQIFAPNLGD